jgi:hypothetical protein
LSVTETPAAVIARSFCDEAIQFFLVASGLLRCARNDGEIFLRRDPSFEGRARARPPQDDGLILVLGIDGSRRTGSRLFVVIARSVAMKQSSLSYFWIASLRSQ